jgi:hypothetical protein
MPMRARIHGVVALFLAGLLVAACSGADAGTRTSGSRSSRTSTTTHPAGHVHHHDAHPGHDATMPPLAARVADATPEQRAATADLLARTRATLAAFASEPAARAAGYLPNDATKRVVHYRNVANRRDDHELDPAHPEGLVYLRTPRGELRLLGAVFTVRPGEPAPTPGGDIFSWHTHDPDCGSFLVPAGGCGETFRMLHVWTAPAAVDPWIQAIRDAFGRLTRPGEPALSA